MARGGPTPMNLGTLADLFAGGEECIPNKLTPAQHPHAKKLLSLGLLTVRSGAICLTDAGREALASPAPRRSPAPGKRAPTDTNIFVLGELFGGGDDCVSNRVEQTAYPHVQRLGEFGLIEARPGLICLTDAGREALASSAGRRGQQAWVESKIIHATSMWAQGEQMTPLLRAFVEQAGLGGALEPGADRHSWGQRIGAAALEMAERRFGQGPELDHVMWYLNGLPSIRPGTPAGSSAHEGAGAHGDDDAVLFKHEDEQGRAAIGPVWVRRDGKRENYRDSDRERVGHPGFEAAWFSLATAKRIAKDLGLPLYEV